MSIKRIAMWSGPRNISTAMMRSWGNRQDTFVCDEPLYAHYLLTHGFDHPGREEILAQHETDWRKVAAWLTGPLPEGRTIFYQKQMAHHLLPHIERDWLDQLTHCFLIREPREMLTSLLKKIDRPTLADTGLPQQIEIMEHCRSRDGVVPPIIDSKDVLSDPRGILKSLCRAVGVPFDEDMLHWNAGRRDTDGIWAKYWYDAVEKSTGFGPYVPKDEAVPDEYNELLAAAEACYEQLFTDRLTPAGQDQDVPQSAATADPISVVPVAGDVVPTTQPHVRPASDVPATTQVQHQDHVASQAGTHSVQEAKEMLQTYNAKNRDILININGKLHRRSEAGISPFDSVVQGGDAVWEGLRLYDGRIFRLYEHLDRLRGSGGPPRSL